MGMRISVVDASAYFRGLLLLSRKDSKITEAETELLKRIGKALGFEREFCDNAIRDIIDNQYVLTTPPEFSSDELAMRFVRDGLTLAFSDKEVLAFELEWLRATAEKNGLNAKWFIQQLKGVMNGKEIQGRLEVDGLSVKHS